MAGLLNADLRMGSKLPISSASPGPERGRGPRQNDVAAGRLEGRKRTTERVLDTVGAAARRPTGGCRQERVMPGPGAFCWDREAREVHVELGHRRGPLRRHRRRRPHGPGGGLPRRRPRLRRNDDHDVGGHASRKGPESTSPPPRNLADYVEWAIVAVALALR
jgi:hypothetical protein